jgi:simple sugar transport system permease protein
MRFDLRRVALTPAAPVLALLAAVLIASLVLVAAGDPVLEVWKVILTPPKPRNVVNIVNGATVLYLSGLAVAIGFRMNLFNIGVDGQYRLAAFVAAYVGGEAWLPGALNTVLIIVTAMLVGAMWAGVAAILKVTRGVSEVISTIMLNAIATSLVAYLLREVSVQIEGSNNIGTQPIPESSRIPGIALIPGAPNLVYGFIVVAIAAGIAYWFVLSRTTLGFNLRATGRSETAAIASGISVKRMVIMAMLISGAVAGLVGMPLLLGEAYSYGLTFQSGLGFAGIAVALLGRNNPIGIAIGALLFAYLNEQSNPLQILVGVSDDIVKIVQGIVVLTVVIAYEVVRRYGVAQEQRKVARELAADRQRAAEEVSAS